MTTNDQISPKPDEHADSRDGYFQISEAEDGIYLTVYPPQGQGLPVKEQDIVSELSKLTIEKYDQVLLNCTMKEAAGTQVKVAEPSKPEVEPDIRVVVTRDKMEASLQVDLPKSCREVLLDEVVSKIEQSGVTFGVDLEAARKALESPGIQVVCASGQSAVDGVNAVINYKIDMENKGRPVELEDGRVDFKNLNIFTIVAQGDLLAEKIPATPGTPGIDVLGQPVPAKNGKDIPLPVGKNVQAVDGVQVVAGIAGQLVIANNKINVIPVIEIKEDVDLSTGNIEFVGNVIVRGSVQAGFSIKAEGNVEIYGTVSGGSVEGNNVTIKMGIQGMHRGYVKATENVATKFIENGTVHAGKDILVSDVILNSNISAGKKVIVEGRRGLITGGTVVAGEEIRAQVVGTHMATNTELGVGVNPGLREEYQTLRKELKKVELSAEQTQKALNILRNMDQSTMSQDKREMLLKLTKAQFHLAGQTENMRNRLTEIDLALEEMRYGRIKVANIIYPGVKIVVGTLVKPIREQLKFVSLYAEEGEIKVGAFK